MLDTKNVIDTSSPPLELADSEDDSVDGPVDDVLVPSLPSLVTPVVTGDEVLVPSPVLVPGVDVLVSPLVTGVDVLVSPLVTGVEVLVSPLVVSGLVVLPVSSPLPPHANSSASPTKTPTG